MEGDLLVLPAKVAYERSYTATEAGLAAMLRDLAVDKRIGIAVRFMDGKAFGGEADKQYHPASTYKMFVAYSVLKRIESGQMKWDAAAIGGKNIDQCFEVMIVHSDNTCAEWFGDTIGWQTVSNETHALGLSSTVVVRGKMKTTAADATLFLWKLEKGKILPDDLQGKLLSAMRRQIYRSGIPAGVGVPVADKVGFLDGDLHDAALVYGPKTYSLAIFSSGSSWGAIADAARQVQGQIDRL